MQILNDKSYHTISEDIARPIEGRASRAWWIAFGITLLATLWGGMGNMGNLARRHRRVGGSTKA